MRTNDHQCPPNQAPSLSPLTANSNARYIMTECYYAKRDSRLAAYGDVVLQKFEFIKVWMRKIIDIIAEILIFFNKNDLLQCLVVFSLLS